MATSAWLPFLERFSREVIADREQRKWLPPEVITSAWLGFPPAPPAEIEALEKRLGTKLADSYRSFLLATNGWRTAGAFVYDLLPASEVTWFRDSHKDWLDAWEDGASAFPEQTPVSDEEYFVYGPEQNSCNFRDEYWRATLAISGIGDSAIYLLNPLVVTADGEWEAWCFANWLPGAHRHRTFWDLMEHELESFVQLRQHSESRYFPEDGIETLRPKMPGLIKELAEKAQGHGRGKEQRAARGQSALEEHTDGIIEALNDAEAEVRRILTLKLSSDEFLAQLIALDDNLDQKWKANVRPGACEVDRRDGLAEGNREATGIIRWFLNQAQW